MLNSYTGSIIIFISLLVYSSAAPAKPQKCSKLAPVSECLSWQLKGDAFTPYVQRAQSVPGPIYTCTTTTCGPYTSRGLVVKYLDGGSGLTFNTANFPNLNSRYVPLLYYTTAPLLDGITCSTTNTKKTALWAVNYIPAYVATVVTCIKPHPTWCTGNTMPETTIYAPVTYDAGTHVVIVDGPGWKCF